MADHQMRKPLEIGGFQTVTFTPKRHDVDRLKITDLREFHPQYFSICLLLVTLFLSLPVGQ